MDVRRLPEARELLAGVWERVVEEKLDGEDARIEVARKWPAHSARERRDSGWARGGREPGEPGNVTWRSAK